MLSVPISGEPSQPLLRSHFSLLTLQKSKLHIAAQRERERMWGGSGVAVAMVTMEFLDVGLNTLIKVAMSRGMSDFVFVVYSNALATLVLLPCCFIFYRTRALPKITVITVSRIFLFSLLACSLQMCMYIGIGYSSPTLASAMTDLTPAFTFVLALISRMEKLDMRFKSSQAKSIGTIISIAGALIVTLYKGPPIIIFASSPSNLLNELLVATQSNWAIGGFLLATGSFLIALLYVVQTWIIKDYPAELMVTLISSFFVAILSAMVSLVAERDPNAWTLGLDTELIAIVYSGILVVALRNVVHTWALRKKGPVYVCMFKPLGIVIAVLMGVTFLGDILHLGSVIGAATIALGFYSVVWGKAEEEKVAEDSRISSSGSSSHKVPLLQNKSMEV
ncbi:hypothetical protein L1049_007033 [Liquidambar formosana]|uniref:WAT1-related protein n=1 Tax=Liquidambar formosana TaxID=63359 RepID=A0AAP0RGH0_LIQFO